MLVEFDVESFEYLIKRSSITPVTETLINRRLRAAIFLKR